MSQAELTKALLKAQSEFPAIVKNAKNPHLKNKYADLGEILGKTQPVLAANGLCVSQSTINDAGIIVLVTRLMHTSGAELRSDLPLQLDGPQKGMQALGSAISYARRYGITAILSVVADEDDDDGHASSHRQAPQQQRQDWPAPDARPSTAPKAAPAVQWVFQTEHTDESFPNATALIKYLATVKWTYDLALHNEAVVNKALDAAAAALNAKPDNSTVKALHKQIQEVAQQVLDKLGKSDTVDDGMLEQPELEVA